MFIKIKAQSSDFEGEYIRERNIFKKKRKTPKLFFTVLLLAGIAGYFYYLNSGNPLQTDHTIIASSEQTSDVIPANGEQAQNPLIAESNDDNSEKINQESQLITEAIANDEPEQLELMPTNDTQETQLELSTDTEITAIKADEESNVSQFFDNDEIQSEKLDAQSLAEIENPEFAPEENTQVTTEELNEVVVDNDAIDTESITTEKQEPQVIAENEAQNADEQLTNPELVFEEKLEDSKNEPDQTIDNKTEQEPLVAEVFEIDEEPLDTKELISATETEMPDELQDTDFTTAEQPDSEPLDVITTENTVMDSIIVETDQNIDDVVLTDSPNINIDEQSVANISEEIEADQTKEISEPSLQSDEAELISFEEDSGSQEVSNVANATTDIDDITDEVSEDGIAEYLPVIESTDPPVAKNPVEINDQPLELVGTESNTSPIDAISKMISNVFAKTSDEQKLVADVVEIDFSKVTNPQPNQERLAIITVTDSVESEYQGDSEEELSESSFQPISDDDLEITDEVTVLEVRENDVKEIIEQEKQNLDQSANDFDNRISVFDGVDSISAAEIPVKTSHKPKKLIPAEPADVETIQIAKIETTTQEQLESEQAINSGEQSVAIVEDNNSQVPAPNKSTITIKELYDQLMADLDENEQPQTNKEAVTTETAAQNITIKEIYNQISQSNNEIDAPSAEILTQIDTSAEVQSTITEQPVTKVEVRIDPDKSLAMADNTETELKLGPVENLVISSNVSGATEIEPELTQATVDDDPEPVQQEETVELAYISSKRLSDNKGSTPLMIAALNSDDQTVRELIQQGARINARNDWGWTALLNATIKGNRPMVDYLLRNGASPHLADNDGRSPLMAAILNNHPDIVKILLTHKADVNKANRDGWTALSFAAWKGDVASVKYLLEANAFKQHQTSEGLTPLQLAQQGDHTEVINLLTQ